MTQDEIIRMAREAGFRKVGDGISTMNGDYTVYGVSNAALERFAAIVSEATKEKAAKVCDKVAKHYITNNKEQEQVWLLAATSDCAAAIREMK